MAESGAGEYYYIDGNEAMYGVVVLSLLLSLAVIVINTYTQNIKNQMNTTHTHTLRPSYHYYSIN